MYKYKKIIYTVCFLFLISLDQISKYIIRTKGGFYICNENLAFGISINWIFIILIILSLLIFILKKQETRNKKQENFKSKISIIKKNATLKKWLLNIFCILFLGNWLFKTSTILILSGAIANIIDRLYFGCVIDFIDLKFWPIFNFADIYITIGVAILITQHITCSMKQKSN